MLRSTRPIAHPLEQHRGGLENARAAGREHRIYAYRIRISGAGESFADVKFPVSFVEPPILSKGGEIVSGGMADGSFPWWSVGVAEWVTEEVDTGTVYTGARVSIIVGGVTAVVQDSRAHVQFEGTISIEPTPFVAPFVFSPLTAVPWAHAYWVEGPEFVALGLANGGDITVWPDEIGTSNLVTTSGSTGPNYATVTSTLNNKPAARFPTAFGSEFLRIDWADIPRPWTVVAVLSIGRTSGSASAFIDFGHPTSGATDSNHFYTNFSPNPDQFGTSQSGNTYQGGVPDTAGHLFEMTGSGFYASLYRDQVTMFTNAGNGFSTNEPLYQMTLGRNWNGSHLSNLYDFAFVGVIGRLLDVSERHVLLNWSQTYYGTP